jgi:hypothetical protein
VGLFERREARVRLAAVASQADAEREHRNRIDATGRSAALTFLPPRLLFVLHR